MPDQTLRDELAEAESRAAHLRARIASEGCVTAGHDWQMIGGKNAGCHDDCGCSVPVNVCKVCGDSDYGDNSEAEHTLAHCPRREDADPDA